MPTKDELLAFAEANGIAADSSMLKADVEAAIYDAGYDPTNLGEEPVSETDPQEIGGGDIGNTSSDAANSTYTEVEPDVADAGRQVEQERGEPTEAAE